MIKNYNMFRIGLFLMVFAFYSTTGFGQFAEVGQVWYACNGELGAAQILILEGTEDDYFFVWPHDGTESLYNDQLAPGEYLFYIENKFGCKEEIIVEIQEVSGCTSKPEVTFNRKKCVYEVFLFMTNSEGDPLPEPLPIVNWNYNNLVGNPIQVTIPANQNSLELCYDFELLGTDGAACCSDSRCFTINRDDQEKFCEAPNTCKLVINEVVKDDDKSFVEFIVVGEDDKACQNGCDVRGAIIDDNNGGLVKDDLPLDELYSRSIDKGYVVLSQEDSWGSVPLGSRIVIYKDSKNESWDEDPTDVDNDNEYYVWIKNATYINGFTTGFGGEMATYEYQGFPSSAKWDFIKYDTGFDGLQTNTVSSDKKHSIATGNAEIVQLHGNETVPLPYSFSTDERLSIRLLNGNYNLSTSYEVTTGAGVYTPGAGNTLGNTGFIQILEGCSDKLPENGKYFRPVTSVPNSLWVSPNPFGSESVAHARFPKERLIVFELMTSSGLVLYQKTTESVDGNFSLDLGQVLFSKPAGVYYLKAKAESGVSEITKVVKTK